MTDITQAKYQKAVNRVVDYIGMNLYDVPTTRELAEIANISPYHLHRIFKSIIGENIGEFIIRLRLEDVALRLLMSKDPVETIAYEVGYATKFALSKAFKRHFKVSPSLYRKQSKNIHPFFGEEPRKRIELSPEIRIVKAKTVVYIRIIDVYGAEASFSKAWAQLGEFAHKHQAVDNSVEFIGLSFDDPAITNPSRCRFYACFTPCCRVVPQGAFGVKEIPGGKYAVFLHNGAYYKLKDTYYNIYVNWLPKSKYRIRGSMSFEKYLNSPKFVSEKELQTEIYIPII